MLLGGGLLLWQQPWSNGSDPDVGRVGSDAAADLTSQFAALSAATSEAQLAEAAGSSSTARSFAAASWKARTDLDVGPVSLRYVSGGTTPQFDNGDTRAQVEVSWAGDDATVQFRMRPRGGGGFDVVSAGLGAGALPVWLAGPLQVDRSGGLTVVTVGGGDPDLDVRRLATVARTRVADVVPEADGPLTVVSTPSPEVAGALLGQSASSVRQIAAVSTRLDDRQGSLAGPAVVLNPGVFATMDARAAQIVMTHEATHVLTGAIGSRADTWVIEGFADFVALHDDDEPLAVSAGQVLRQVKADGPPDALPTAEAFDESAYGLGAVYESAWLVFEALRQQSSDADLIAFYDDVRNGEPTDAAARQALGLTTAEITARWRSYLTKSASTVS